VIGVVDFNATQKNEAAWEANGGLEVEFHCLAGTEGPMASSI
jgi:hypothetical protein